MAKKNQNNINRYSDQELADFKSIIDQKLERAQGMVAQLKEQLEDTQANFADNDSDWLDDSANQIDLEMLQTMVHRQHKHIQDLENALIRIKNKNYGICVVTGSLIDKARLKAVPTTTKSMAAKTASTPQPKTIQGFKREERKERESPKVISRIIRKSTPPASNGEHKEDYEDYDGEGLDFDITTLDLGNEEE